MTLAKRLHIKKQYQANLIVANLDSNTAIGTVNVQPKAHTSTKCIRLER